MEIKSLRDYNFQLKNCMKIDQKNAKIYSRPRINIEKYFIGGNTSKSGQKWQKNASFRKIFIILIIAAITATFIIRSINPIIDDLCLDEAKNIATKIANEQATAVMEQYSYEDFITVVKDDQQNVVMLQANVNTINSISSDIPVKIVEAFEKDTNSKINIHFGSLFGIKIFSGAGPKLTAKIANTGNVETTLKSEFTAQGINQTLHRIYLEIDAEVSILTPYNTIKTNIVNQVLIAESIIVGNVPDSYYNLNTTNSDDAIRVID